MTSGGRRELIRQIFSRRMGVCIVLGFSSGLPLYVLMVLVNGWLRSSAIDLKTIGLLALLMIPYTWKFLWAPLLDRFSLLGMGRRRGWMLATQILLLATIAILGFIDPQGGMFAISAMALLISLASATQDIAIDAYRREFLSDEELGLGNSLFVNAYRIASLVPGGLSLIVAGIWDFRVAFVLTALFMLPGIAATLLIREPQVANAPRTLRDAIVEPFREFVTRRGVGSALLVVLFVFLYKLGDSMATALSTPFYIDLGYSLTEIGVVAKNAGLWSMVAGGLLGGIWMLRLGINRALWIFGVAQAVTILGFMWIAHVGTGGCPPVYMLALVIAAEALGTGLGTAAFVSFIARETNPAFTATQFALLTSCSAVPRTFCNAVTGYIVEAVGWEQFFLICTLLTIPGMLLLFKVAPYGRGSQGDS
ncbi:MAG: AmpG family muropeptide MFS transporter [Succinivibrionaceae bacterium]|nr:AmpG family muropeptide MFS transporter [Succinivibrionaceae bacterium]